MRIWWEKGEDYLSGKKALELERRMGKQPGLVPNKGKGVEERGGRGEGQL